MWLLIISFLALFLMFFPELIVRNKNAVNPSDVQILDSLVAVMEKNVSSDRFVFDPNKITKDSLLLLGFPEKVADRLINYRSKGGIFYTKKDVKKIYGLSEQLMDSLYSFIDLPDSLYKVTPKSVPIFDINNADVNLIKRVKLIGDVLAERIVKYRELLGGYVHEDQYEEVYGMEEEVINNLKSASRIAEGFNPRLIKINMADHETLKRHPYISDQLAADIIQFREINSIIESEKVLANFKSVDKSNFQKLILYLDFQ